MSILKNIIMIMGILMRILTKNRKDKMLFLIQLK